MSKKQIRFIKGSITDYDEAKMQGVIYFATDEEQIIVDGIEFGGSNYWEELQLENLFPIGSCVISTHPINKFSFRGGSVKGKWYSSDGQEGLYNSSNLTTITFKEEGEYTLKFVNNYTYTDGPTGLLSVTDNSVKSVLMIGGSNGKTMGIKPVNKNENAKLIFYNNITNISDRAFEGCKGFTGELILPENLTSIGDSAFRGCSGFTSLKLPENLTSIGETAFYNCYRFTGDLIIPESVTSIGKSAFYYCSNLSRIYVCEDTKLGTYWNNGTNAEVIKYKKGEKPWIK